MACSGLRVWLLPWGHVAVTDNFLGTVTPTVIDPTLNATVFPQGARGALREMAML